MGVKQAKNFVVDVSNNGYQANYSGFSAHTYDKPTEANWLDLITAASAINKPVYNEESNAAGGGPLWGEEPTIGGVINIYTGKTESYRAGLRGELFFEIWSRGITKETRAVYFTKGQKGNRLRGYWLIKAFIDGVYNKHYIAHTTPQELSDIKVMAFSDDEYITAYVINASTTNAFTNLPITLNDKVITSNTIVAQTWSEDTPKMGVVSGITKTSSNSFSVNVAPSSLVIYKFRIGGNATINLSLNQNEITATEQSFNLDVTANQPWVITQLPNWLTVDQQSGDASTTITFNAIENMSNVERAATIYVNDVPLLVVQSGGYGQGEGDVNLDGVVNAADLESFRAVYGLSNTDKNYLLSADLDVDGKITKRDYSQLYAIFLQQ
ncbi:dockerin type I domain-containing protein [Psychrosphaera algicola]|uniref:Dockerin type I domain-containing protein n=1 Tax=Psychrosphaera algicola TaxID=3023714 RepID=A0ABT5FB90_9GAMM|nr:dockerin type I domain-containing protein [Psychrosphaera sp. G1-22]MDC2888809.1 dockerin type I domain-containing protein [Psychrosphaera sp. G1-22]